MRVYEWGHEGGRKVMMVHGDATSAPVWKRVAAGLVAKGCRVIVIGRLSLVLYAAASHTFNTLALHGKSSGDAVKNFATMIAAGIRN
jgi:phosphoglucomutase